MKTSLIELTNELYQLTLLFPKKEPLRYKLRETADDILADFISLTSYSSIYQQNEIVLQTKNLKTKLEILDSFLEVAKNQNWVNKENILRLKEKYQKLLKPFLLQDIKISILIPCFNEEKSIRKCIESCLNQTKKPYEIVVVDDGSTDRTPEILKSFEDKITVVRIPKNTGNKSYAQEFGLKFIHGDVFITTDADTILDKNFVKRIFLDFKDRKVAAVAGYVRSLKYNWLTTCRELDYIIGQDIHKLAQSYINALFVIPGCAGAFRTEVFKKYIGFDHDTVTEDLDFTYKLHENQFKIIYDKKAIAYTQDPQNLKSYINQMKRWYRGGWQNLIKHLKSISKKEVNVFELSLIYIEGLMFSALLFLIPLLNINFFRHYIFFYFAVLFGCAVYGALTRKRLDLLFCFPFYFLIVFLNAWIFWEEFIKEIIFKNGDLAWFKPERARII